MVARVTLVRLALVALASSAFAEEAGVDVPGAPSGQAITYVETVQGQPGPEGLAVRFRFLAPQIARDGGTVDAEAAQADMEWLCETFALPRLPATGPVPSQVIISLADQAVPFGETAPEVTQYFEAYSLLDGHCVWEAF